MIGAIDIAPLGNGDAADAVTLWAEAGLLRPWNDPRADIERALAGPASTILAARHGTRLTGTVMVGHDGHRGWLYYLAVAEAHRGRGIARRLVSAAEDWLRVAGCPKVQLMVRHDNAAASGFYAALGYEPQAVVVLGRRLDGR